jgi:hypothetical protein
LQTPVWQVSVCVHSVPSLQAAPSALAGLEQAPVFVSQLPALWHWSLAVQVTGLAPAHTPPWHVSVLVHGLASSQVAPFVFAGSLHRPLDVSQVPAEWHWSLAAHTTALAPVQTPPWHESLLVHALPSLHPVPLALAGLLQTPVAALQVPASWHWSVAVQVTGFVPLQTPAWQLEGPVVHRSPSSHAVPSTRGVAMHCPVEGLHVPT